MQTVSILRIETNRPLTESIQPKKRKIEGGFPIENEVRKHFPNGTRELKTMSGTRTCNNDAIRIWMTIDDKMAVRRIGIKADRAAQKFTVGGGEELFQEPAHILNVGTRDTAINCVRGSKFSLMMERHLHAAAKIREAIKHFVRLVFPKVNGKAIRSEKRGFARGELEQHLALDREQS